MVRKEESILDWIYMSGFQRFANSRFSGVLLNLLLPGAGHAFFRDYLFGIFILLVWLIAVVLFYLSFLIHMNPWAKLILFGLPAIFYFFTFLDLVKSIKKKKELKNRSLRFSVITYLIVILYLVFSPTAPVNFMINNGPVYFMLSDNTLSPLYHRGAIMKASRLAYKIEIVGFKRPFYFQLPERYDVIRLATENGMKTNAIVLGLPEEQIEMIEGTVIVNGEPDFEGWTGGLNLTGDCPVTSVQGQSLLVATLNLGAIDKIYQVPISNLIGKVGQAWQ